MYTFQNAEISHILSIKTNKNTENIYFVKQLKMIYFKICVLM